MSAHVRVLRREDGLWLNFGPYASFRLEELLADHGPIFVKNAREFCESVAEEEVPKDGGALDNPPLPDGISRCGQLGYHVYMAGPCFDRLKQAVAYKASLDAEGVKWRAHA